MRNLEVAKVLDDLGELVEANGEDRFKVIAYHRAATSIRNLGEDVELVWKDKRLEEIKYVGEGIAKKIDEYLGTGKLGVLETLRGRTPAGVSLLMKVPGIGPRTAFHLAHDLGITSVEQLNAALGSGKLDSEFGPTVREGFRIGIEKLQSFERRLLLPEAEGVFQKMKSYFGALGIEIGMAGSLRRGKSTVGDLDILSTDPRVLDATRGCPGVAQVLEGGPRRYSVKLEDGVQVDVRLFTREEYGAALVYFTGSKEHNITLRNLALGRGWKLNEYGLFEAGGNRVSGETEDGVYDKLGLQYVPPELRENNGEVEAALSGKLPHLVELDDVRGDLQMHTTWSDGAAELEEMARAAMERGYEYIAVTDHSQSVRVANGLTEERFRRQWKEIEKLNDRLAPFRILRGVEVEIKNDGSLDFDGKFLDEFDIVGASLHQNFRQDPETLTRRVLKAVSAPSVDFLCHPTNRLIGRREGNPIDLARVITAAKESGKMLETDGQPNRLDLDETWAKRAAEEGVKIVVDSDAHTVGDLDNISYGVTVARRAWLKKQDVANTLGLKALLKLIG
ncbi:MAG: DNA polymerase/3'-5' exonuclease PolX [Nitrososphaerota archaeon]|nr:DNA polymerase/3'-5' exonuclease PolX [Nitrososphaerota archaeon]MDG6990482.1 DNA polymerase/3'-5' exonuclease PolX [Nitrososphaerota archaeon]